MNPRSHVRWVLVVSIALATQFSCGGGEKASPDRGLASPEIHRGGFIVRVFSMEPDHDGVFVEHLRECALPVWNELKAAGVVSKVSIFELSEIETTFPVSPPWRYLLVVGLGTEASATDFVAAEQASRCPKGSAVASYTVVREEHMVCTPNSCFGLPESAYPDAPTGIDYLIELISVKNTPASLAKYHDLMSSYIGPANGLLVERGMLHCFVALETIAAEIGKHEVVPWNQVHVSDHWDEGGDVDWEAVYEDLFRDEFSRELDEVWAEIPPIREVSSEYRGRLVTDLCVR